VILARDLVAPYRGRYHCLLFKPVWLVETARGCPFRCSFCSVWPLYGRSFRERAIDTVASDLQDCGDSVFIVDDLFWNHPERSLALARELRRRNVRKRWILVQSRTDVVARHAALLEAWRPIARDFDIFFGLESPSDRGLEALDKDASLGEIYEAFASERQGDYSTVQTYVRRLEAKGYVERTRGRRLCPGVCTRWQALGRRRRRRDGQAMGRNDRTGIGRPQRTRRGSRRGGVFR